MSYLILVSRGNQFMKKAILLLNMGGPNNIDEVELFLKNMFNDPNILPINRFFRKIVSTIIIKKRLAEAQENYRQIGGKSPLLEITNNLALKIEQKSGIKTLPIMRYVPPFATDILKELQNKNYQELILVPMYPHYSTTTTKSSVDDIINSCKKLNYNPDIKVINSYYDNKEYITIQTQLIIEALKNKNPSNIDLIISAHGLPLSIVQKGDPYQQQIEANFNLLKERLQTEGINFKNITLAYQSKVGKGKWLEPNLSELLKKIKNKNILIFPIAFTIDNSETIFELDIEHREIAKELNYNSYDVCKCPNDLDEFAHLLAELSTS